MISAIMPTMWKGNKGIETIEQLSKQEMIGEIIVIDNSTDEVHLDDFEKVVHIREGKNTYVNPAWNKGAQLAKYDKLLFVNDDVDTDWSFVNALEEYITSDRGMIGAGVSCWQYNEQYEGSGGVVPIGHRPNCYGCVFAIHKESYIQIPEDLLIHYGDDWLFTKPNKPNYEIINWKMSGASEQTSGLTEFDTVKLVDRHNWNNKYK
jgi:hypothetical protein